MKVLLVNPPSGFLLDDRVFLPLGIAGIAAVGRQNGHDISLMDLAGVDDYLTQFSQEVQTGNYNAVGITATSPQFYYANKLLQSVNGLEKKPKMIIGGPHASMFTALRDRLITRFQSQGLSGEELENRLYEEDPNFEPLERFDVIAGGEENSLEAALNSNKRWVNGGITEDLDALPLPARDLFDVKNYLFDSNGTAKFKLGGKAAGSLISQRGCPYTCEFCCGRDSAMYHRVKLPGGTLRAHSPERVLEELNFMHEQFGLDSFMFYDDEFNLHPQRTTNLSKVLSKTGFKFRGFVKSDLLVKHPEVAEAMKYAGFVEVLTGIESGSDRILGRHLRKKTSPSLNYQAAGILLENGIGLKALTMLGHTSETEADIMLTRDWLLKTGKMFYDRLGPGYFTFDLTIFQPYAGCPIWDRSERNISEFSDEFAWRYDTRNKGEIVDPQHGGIYFNKVDFSKEQGFYKGRTGEYRAFVRTRNVTPKRYVELRDAIEHEIRDTLGMKQLAESVAARDYEHSMGQTSSN
jgi:radical SAM superfamily enzyme YgiQ (UPF0313 family)